MLQRDIQYRTKDVICYDTTLPQKANYHNIIIK